jgi:hypothetical protein
LTGLKIRAQANANRFIGLLLITLLALVTVSELRAQSVVLEKSKSTTSSGSLNYFRFENIREVISKWSPNQHLYVKGDLGLSPSQLVELESWLHKRGHWTAILIEDSSNQRYTNEDGRVEVGMDAVELSLSDLMEVGSFRGQVNSVTGERDAAVFILFLNERKFSYRASEAQSRRGLGQNRWIGKLDRPAYRAMRGGGRIIDAVKDTVKSINAPLRNAIAQEQKIAAQREQQRKRAMDDITAQVSQIQDKLIRIKSYAKKVRDDKPSATADLTSPELGGIQSQLAELKESLSASEANVSGLRENVSKIDDASDDWINLYNEYARFEDSHSQLTQRRTQLASDAGDLSSAIDSSLSNVDSMLTDARDAYDKADSKFQKHLNAAAHELKTAKDQLATSRDDRQRTAARQSLIRRTAMAVGGFLSTLVAGLLFWLNRRRGPSKTRAIERLEARQNEVNKEMEGVGDLLERADIVVGDRKAIERKGYQGKTKELSETALEDIDDILVMSNSVDKVMEGAKEKIEPQSWWRRMTNRFSSRGYDEGYDMLENQPIEFGENDGISIVRDEGDGPIESQDSVDADGQKKKTISLSFKELFKIFRKRSERVSGTIDQVESGWTQIVSTNTDLQAAIDQAYDIEQEARSATEQDSLLSVPQLFENLLKSAQADQDASEVLGKTDPISAIAGPATDGLRKAANADQLSRELVDVRKSAIPSMRKNANALAERNRQVEWIDAALDDFADRAQSLATEAMSSNVEESISLWRGSFDKFTAAVGRAVELHDQSVGEVTKAIAAATDSVASARATIAERLKLAPDKVLAERDRAANDSLAFAAEHNAAAQSSLDRGDPPAAELSIAESLEWVETANHTASESLRILDELPRDSENLTGEIDSLKRSAHSSGELLNSIEGRFADSALVIEGASIDGKTDLADGDEGSTTIYEAVSMSAGELYRMAVRQQQQSTSCNDDALVFYKQGRLLEADESYQRAMRLLQHSRQNLQLLTDHAQSLEQLVSDNQAGIGKLQTRFDDLEETLNQHHVTRGTQQTARSLHEKFGVVSRSIEATTGRRDPTAEGQSITDIDGQFDQFRELLNIDQAMYDEAGRSIGSLRQLLASAGRTVQRSKTDQITDSRRVEQGVQQLEEASRVADKLSSQLKAPHENWSQIDQEADQTLARATQSLASLQQELDRAQSAAAAIERAANEYRSAMGWSGSYGIRANPRRVRHTLDQARDALSRGDYNGASNIAQQSISLIANAIAIAQNEVRRRQAAERRRAEQRRRRKNRSIGGGSIMIPSGFPDFGSGRRSSRSSSSSRRSSSGRGGFSRSGW